MPIGVPLDGPPPSPANPPMPGGGPPMGGPPGLPPGPTRGISGQPQDATGAAMALGKQLDMSLMKLSQAFPKGAAEFAQAKQLIMAGIAKSVQGGPGAPTPNPTEPGNQFPGTSPSAGGP